MSDAVVPTGLSRRDEAKPSTEGLSTPAVHGIASVAVYGDPRSALAAWGELSATASGTPYQMAEWVLPWVETVGRSLRIAPMIVVARDAEGHALALLPLGIQRHRGLATASFLGAKDSNFNMGLFRPGTGWTRASIESLLRQAVVARGGGVDLFAFRNQPEAWQGVLNPLLALAHQPSPSFAYKAELLPDPEAFLKAHLSRESRKKLRQKMNRLRDLGPVALVETRTPAEATEVLSAFEVQRMARNVAAGFGSEDLPTLCRFLDRTVGGDGPITFYGLRCGDRIVATLGGAMRRDRFSGMLSSFAAEPDVARTSPGDLLLAEVMKHHCTLGFRTFDLGIGEARYKETYCPDAEVLFDSLVPVTARGYLCARAEALRLQMKRTIKQSHWAWPLVQRIRRARAALSEPV